MGRRPKDELAILAQTARDQVRRARDLGKSLDERIAEKRAGNEKYTLNEDDRRDFASITLALQHGGNVLTRVQEASKKNMGGLTEAQVEAQWAAEIVRAATQISDEDWARMVDARIKAKAARG